MSFAFCVGVAMNELTEISGALGARDAVSPEEPEGRVDIWQGVTGLELSRAVKDCAVSMIVRAVKDIVVMRMAQREPEYCANGKPDYARRYRIRDGLDAIDWVRATKPGGIAFADCCHFLGVDNAEEMARRVLADPEGILSRFNSSISADGAAEIDDAYENASPGEYVATFLRTQENTSALLSSALSEEDGSSDNDELSGMRQNGC